MKPICDKLTMTIISLSALFSLDSASATEIESPLYTPTNTEVLQMLEFKSLDGAYWHYKGLPLALKLMGLPYSQTGSQLFKEVEKRVQAYQAKTKKPNPIEEARFILNADTNLSDKEIKNRIGVIDQVIQSDPDEQAKHPHATVRKVFMLFPHSSIN
jgi:hypothetical protein